MERLSALISRCISRAHVGGGVAGPGLGPTISGYVARLAAIVAYTSLAPPSGGWRATANTSVRLNSEVPSRLLAGNPVQPDGKFA
jgi:hypothetical protein